MKTNAADAPKIPLELQKAYHAGELCLFVGAGISVGCGLPDWRELAKGVVLSLPYKPGPPLGARAAALRAKRPPPPDPNALRIPKEQMLAMEDPLRSMRYVRCDPDVDLKSLVRRCLYRKPVALSQNVREIPSLAKVRRICCFNYDDILDRAFGEISKTYVALFASDPIPLEAPETLIFYPHGFLPAPDIRSHSETDAIVLSEDDYFDLYSRPYAWANLVQLTLLLNYTALFIGCSLLDPNIRRLLDTAAKIRRNHRHYVVFRDPYFQQDANWLQATDSSAFRSVQERILSGLGVLPIWVQEYSGIASVLKQLRA